MKKINSENYLEHLTYFSPFTWRYGSSTMRSLFSEKYKYRLWRDLWVRLAEAEYKIGLITKKELTDLKKNKDNLNISKILHIEKEKKHDVIAAILEFAEKAKNGGGKIHLGATSMDITDNADIIRMKQGLTLIKKRLRKILQVFANKILQYASFPCLGYTHLQPAEPTTVGFRLAFYAQDLLTDFLLINDIENKYLKLKGFRGAVGTSASFQKLLENKKKPILLIEEDILKDLKIDSFFITSQTYPRKLDYLILSSLASLAQSCSKFAFDLRILQSPQIGEWSEPFDKKQVGSSTMPFKKNPINCEKICSLARYLSVLPQIAWENAASSLLERTLDDSANRRLILPEAFLTIDEILITTEKVITGIIINKKKIGDNLKKYAPFFTTETLLMAMVNKGADRQKIHEELRKISIQAWDAINKGFSCPLEKLLFKNKIISYYLNKRDYRKLINFNNYLGNAPYRAQQFAQNLKKIIDNKIKS